MMKSIIRGFAVTAFVFLIGLGASQLGSLNLFSAFDPIGQALSEFELTDIVFSNLRDDPKADSSIVIANIGQASRMEIAQMLAIISRYKPRVIGIDSFFNCEGGLTDSVNCPQIYDTLSNLMLSNAIQEAGNVVMVSRLLQTDSAFNARAIDYYDSLEISDPLFSDYATNAFANLPTSATYQEDVKSVKSVIPQWVVNGKRQLAFSVMMAMKVDSVKTKKFLARGNEEEVIKFRGNIAIPDQKLAHHREAMAEVSKYNGFCGVIDMDDVLSENFDTSYFANKVVILGFLGNYLGHPAWEDKFFTPLNAKVAGRANPDMFGPVVHANVVSMILHEDYIDEIPGWAQYLIAFLACFLNVLLFRWIDDKFPVLFDGLSVVLQLVQIAMVGVFIIYAFQHFSLKLELSTTMAALALVGPCFDICKSIENSFSRSLTTSDTDVLTTTIDR
ncbi:MAG TPA: CHASE2 domain-containing protein [Chryseosolibacter sp.]|nr:CHASE2 domain-containing protein [Chryseosolibacter sp.]